MQSGQGGRGVRAARAAALEWVVVAVTAAVGLELRVRVQQGSLVVVDGEAPTAISDAEAESGDCGCASSRELSSRDGGDGSWHGDAPPAGDVPNAKPGDPAAGGDASDGDATAGDSGSASGDASTSASLTAVSGATELSAA